MAGLAAGLELYNENRFEEAVRCFYSFLENNENLSHERDEAFQKLISIYDSLKNDHEKIKIEKRYFCFLVEEKEYQKAYDVFERLLNENTTYSLEEIHSFWFSLVQVGDVSKAVTVAEKYAEMLFNKKNFERGLLFVQDIEKNLGEKEMVFFFYVQFLHLKKDYSLLNKMLHENFAKVIEGRDFRKNIFLTKVVDYLAGQGNDENQNFLKYVFKAMLLRSGEKLSERRLLGRRKKVIHEAIN